MTYLTLRKGSRQTPKNPDADKKTEYQDNADRTEVRRRSGLGLSRTGPEDTTKSSILSADLLFLWKTGTGELLRRNYLYYNTTCPIFQHIFSVPGNKRGDKASPPASPDLTCGMSGKEHPLRAFCQICILLLTI